MSSNTEIREKGECALLFEQLVKAYETNKNKIFNRKV
jgi:hypothetical protein